MKVQYLFLSLCLALSLYAQEPVTLDLEEALGGCEMTADGYWVDTYRDGVNVEQNLFRFSHTGTSDGGGGMAYWDGFTLCTNGSAEDFGKGDSDGWILHQWGCMAGGGLNSEGQVEEGAPYLVAYWGFSMENEQYHSVQVDLTDGKLHKALGVYICNHPWPYYGNINGDSFSEGFSKDGDRFVLIAHGLNEQGEPTGATATHILAEFKDGRLLQSDQWEYFDLTPLGTIGGIYFTMATTDEDALYGANTAVYFCLDKLSVSEAIDQEQMLLRPSGLTVTEKKETTLTLTWNEVANAQEYILSLNNERVGVTNTNTYTFTNLEPYTEYTLSVTAANADMLSETASVTASTIDETAPEMPTDITVQTTSHSITVTWLPAKDNVGIKRYNMWLDGTLIRRTTATEYTITDLLPATNYLIELQAEDIVGNKSEKAQVYATTLNDTALDETLSTDNLKAVYNLSGQYVGHQVPTQKGVYILIYNKHKTKIIN